MNLDQMDDQGIVERLRTALDEVAASPATVGRPSRDGWPAGRWLAIAASIALVAAAVTAVVVNRGHRETATVPARTTAPATTSTAPTPTGNDEWFTLTGTDLTPGEIVVDRCCPPTPAPGPATVMAWARTSGIADGVLLLRATDEMDGTTTMDWTAAGMTAAEAQALEAQVVPGSGLPYILPVDPFEVIGVGFEGMGNGHHQVWSSDAGTVTISVGDYRGQLEGALHDGSVHTTAVAGVEAVRGADAEGVHVAWRTASGQWAAIDIDPALASRADELIVAVAAASLPTVVLRGSAIVIESGDRGPMIAFGLRESYPPQGGDVALAGFDWSMVEGEQSASGTTWGGPYELTGTFDGTTFSLTEPPGVAGSTPSLSHGQITDGCTLEQMAPLLDALGTLDAKALHIVSWSSDNFDGRCGVAVTAMLDTPQLRNALLPLGNGVTVTHVFTPVDG